MTAARLLLLAWALGAPRPADSAVDALREALDAGDYNLAVRLGEDLVHRAPEDSEAHDLLGRAYGRKAEESSSPLSQARLAKKARAEFARAVALDPENPATLADLATYDLRAPGLLGGSRRRARELAETLSRLDPSRGHELRGAIAEADGRPSDAEGEYRLATDSPPPLRGRRALSDFLVRRRRYAEARKLWQAEGEAPPEDPVAAYELAGIALASGESLAPYRDALEKSLRAPDAPEDPRRAEVLHRLALLLERTGRRAEAVSLCEDALRLEPNRRAWQKELARLSR